MTPRRFAVVGNPIAHSKSPTMHRAAFRALGLPHTYEAIRATESDLLAVLGLVREGALAGLNVTIPHKQHVLALVDCLDPSARAAGAANTVVRDEDGALTAYNTDAPALAAEIHALAGGPLPPGASALVLGSGGAARAAIAALGLHLGVRDIVVRARSFDDESRRQAFEVAAPSHVRAQAWAPSASSEAKASVLVQATSAGMRGVDGGDGLIHIVDWSALPASAIAIDVVYAPRDTPWLQAARARGLRCDDGLAMLARQGALALELWLGTKAPLAAMRAALE